jgi:hypothetical protein
MSVRPQTPLRSDLVWMAETSRTLEWDSWTRSATWYPGQWCPDGSAQTVRSIGGDEVIFVFPEPLGTRSAQFARIGVDFAE